MEPVVWGQWVALWVAAVVGIYMMVIMMVMIMIMIPHKRMSNLLYLHL